MNTNKENTTILYEHKRVFNTRYILAIFNFIAILAGTLLTLFFVQRRGINDIVLWHIYALLGINVLQILLCVLEYASKGMGRNLRHLPKVTYAAGILWLAVTASELVFATMEVGVLRTDLLGVAIIQLVIASIAYIFWPMMDRKAIDAMIRRSVRDDEKLRRKKSKRFTTAYGFIFFLVILAQAAALYVYKLPPVFYDLFADNRALQYEYNEDLDGYVVKAVYQGTSTKVNIPATYNDKPVVGIAGGAIVDPVIAEKYKFTEITFGTPTVNADVTTTNVCNLTYIAENAIVTNTITDLTIPASVVNLADNAIKSDSIETITYMAGANFNYSSLKCSALSKIVMAGEDVGKIASLEGMPSTVTIEVNKDIYNHYRQQNMEYVANFSPILGDDEFCLDFFTDSSYYIDSIFAKAGESISLTYQDLVNKGIAGASLSADTLAYIKNRNELGTNGAKANSAFRGWYFDSAFSLECEFTENGTLEFNKSTKLYAKWIDEYTGILDWGTHTPIGTSDAPLYWTDYDEIEFPVIKDRPGYKDGITWLCDGTPVTTSRGISKSVTLEGHWNLDAPVVTLTDTFNDQTGNSDYAFQYNKNYGAGQFTYDETRNLTVSADPTHPLDEVTYHYSWKKADASNSSIAQKYRLENVADSGKYFVTVTAISATNETAETTCELDVTIYKKQIVMEGVSLPNMTAEYTSKNYQVAHTGAIHSNNVDVTYRYYNANGDYLGVTGVTDVGEYSAEAIIEKNENYEIVSLRAQITITPKVITITGWESVDAGDDFIYNGAPHAYQVTLSGMIEGYDPGLVYKNQRAVNAGTYTAEVTECTNKNYKLDVVNRTYVWEVAPKMLSVSYWQAGATWDTSDSANFKVVYSGEKNEIYAVPSGVIGDEKVNFIYETQEGYAISAVNAGQYVAHVRGVDNTNYTVDADADSSSQIWTVQKRTLYAGFDSLSLTYNGKVQNMWATVSGFVAKDEEKISESTFAYTGVGLTVGAAKLNGTTVSIPFAVTAAGDYTTSVDGIESSEIAQNYELVPASHEFTVAKKVISVSLEAGSVKTYSGAAQELYLVVNGVESGDLDKFNLSQFSFAEGSNNPSGFLSAGGNFKLAFTCKDAGDYPVKITAFAGDPNYMFADGYTYDGFVTVEKRVITVATWKVIDKANSNTKSNLPTEAKLTYNYHGYEIDYALAGVMGEDNVQLTLANQTAKNAGIYTTEASLDTAVYKNYSFAPVSLEWTIVPKNLNFTWNVSAGEQITYDGKKHKAELKNFDDQLLGDDALSLSISGDTFTNVGSYTATVNGIGNANYQIASGAKVEWHIIPREITVEWDASAALTYNGQYQGPTFEIKNLVDGESVSLGVSIDRNVHVLYSGTHGNAYNSMSVQSGEIYNLAALELALDAGAYQVINVTVGDDNYKLVGDSTVSFSIEKKVVRLSGDWTVSNGGDARDFANLVYNRNAFIVSTTIASGEIVKRLGSNTDVFLDYDATNTATIAGNYTTVVTGLTGTYAANYQLSSENSSFDWTIVPKVVKLVWAENSFIYSGSNKVQNASIATGGAKDDDGLAYESISVREYTANQAVNAGTYTAVATVLNNANYVIDPTTATYEWSIAKKPVSISWSASSFVYNGGVQVPVASYKDVSGKTVIVPEVTAPSSNINVGNYTVEVLSVDDGNYTLEGAANTSCTYQITKRPIQLEWTAHYEDGTAADITKALTYNAKQGTIYATIMNLCGDDEIDIRYSTAQTFKNVGTFTVTVSFTGADNYSFDNQTCNFTYTINPKALTVTWKLDEADVKDIIFDGENHDLIPSLSGFAGSDTVEDLNFSYNKVVAKDVGTYSVSIADFGKDANYVINSGKTQSFKINKQAVTVTWSGASTVVYDGNAHGLTATVKGKDDGKSIAFHYENQYNTNAGTYNVKVVLDDANYTLTGATSTSTLTIDKQPVSITWKWDGGAKRDFIYDKLGHTLEAIVVGKNDKKAVTFSSSLTNSVTNAGTYTAKITNLNSNYTLTGANGSSEETIVIKPFTVTIDWGDMADVVYDGYKHNFGPAAIYGVGGETITLSVSGGSGCKGAGNYQVTVSSNNANYAVNDLDKMRTFKILQKTVTLNWTKVNPREYVYYPGVQQGYSYAVEGVVSGDSVYPSSAGNLTAVNAGNYTITVTGLSGSSAANYKLSTDSVLSQTYTIAKQNISIAWNGETSVVYDGAYHYLTATLTGAVDGVTLATAQIGGNDADSYSLATAISDALLDSNEKANYQFVSTSGERNNSLTITKAQATVEWVELPSGDIVYDGHAHVMKANVLGVGGILLKTYTVSGTDVGRYNLVISETGNDNYTLDGIDAGELNQSMRIIATQVTIEWYGDSGSTVTYDARNHNIVARIYGVDGVLLETQSESYKNVGDYSFKIESVNNKNYTLQGVPAAQLTNTLKIVPAEADFEITNVVIVGAAGIGHRVYYTGEAFVPDIVITDLNSGDSAKATNYRCEKREGSVWSVIDPADMVEAGSYRILVLACDNGNYTIPEDAYFDFEIVDIG